MGSLSNCYSNKCFYYRKCAIEDVPVNPHTVALRANHERLRLIRFEWRQYVKRELHVRIIQGISDGYYASSYEDGWLEESESD